ncbi:hypothetical protein ABZ907_38300 [Nonomuraea wenchangensis]
MARRPAAAQTALGPMVIAAVEQYEPPGRRLVEDGLAAGFLPPADAARRARVRAGPAGERGRQAAAAAGGWAEREQVGAAEYRARYLEPAGRDLAVMDIERFVHAVKP